MASLPYPDPPLGDDGVVLRPWVESDVRCVEALVEPENVASQRVLERAGFVREGCLSSFLIVKGGRVEAFLYARFATS